MLKTVTNIINASQIATPISLPGDVTLSTGNLVIGTASKGIDFSATSSGSGTMTSELLADYEEGTFTPTLLFGGGNTGMTGAFTGRYTKIGRILNYSVVIYLTAKGSSTGNTTIGNFPFTSAGTFYQAVANTDNMTLAQTLVAQMPSGGTVMSIYINNTGTLNNITDVSFGATTRVYITGFYEV
jgi:hypothetical protein